MATNVADFKKANPGYVGRAYTPAPQASKKTSGRGGPLTAFISEAGGAGGAWAGGATGAAIGSVVPGVGTVIGGLLGAAIGGFAGGAGGRAIENKVRDDQNFTGKGGSAKAALTEGAISGALGAAGKGYSALKAGKALTGTKGIGKIGTNMAAGAESQLAGSKATGTLGKVGSSLRANPRGITAGVDQGGGRVLGAAEAKAQNEAIDALAKGSKGITKTGQFKLVDKEITKLKDAYKLTPEAKQLLGQDEVMSLMQNVEKNITANTSLRGNLPKSASTTLNNIYDDLAKMAGKSRGELVDYAAEVNKKAGAIVNKGQVGSKEVQVWEEVRNATKDFIDNTPSFADKSGVNKKLSTLLGAKSNLSRAVTSDVSSGMRQGVTVGRLISDVAGPGMEVAGRGMQATSRIANSAGGNLVKGTAVRGVANNVVNPSAPVAQDPAQYDQALNDLGMTADMGGGQDMTQQMQQPQAELYPAQNMMQDIQRDFQATGGKNVDKYLSLYKALSAVTASQNKASGLNVTKPTSEKLSNAQSGMDSVGQLRQILANNPELVGKSSVPGRGLPVVGGLVSKALGTTDYDAQAYNMMDNLLRIRTGAQANPTEIKKYVTSLLPRLGDSPAEAERKLQIFEKQFGDILQLAGAPNQGGQESYLQDAILNSGGSM